MTRSIIAPTHSGSVKRAAVSKRVYLALAFAVASTSAMAQAYPAKPIKLIVPFVAGGTTDFLARVVAQKLSQRMGTPVIVDNRAGAGGNIGSDVVAKSPPDGYTLLLGTVGTHAINASIYKKMPYDAVKDFAPISLVAVVPNILVVSPAIKVDSVKDLLSLARAKPGAITFASAGRGSSIHMSGELFKHMAGVDMLHVPYKGSGPAIVDLLGGQVDIMFDNLPSALPHIKSGKLKAIAITTATRSPLMPNVPTVAEAGLPGYESTAWFGLLAPAGTPAAIVTRLNTEVVAILNTPDVKERIAGQGAQAASDTPVEFSNYIQSEIRKWAAVAKTANLKAE